jgi:hypothetical protein
MTTYNKLYENWKAHLKEQEEQEEQEKSTGGGGLTLSGQSSYGEFKGKDKVFLEIAKQLASGDGNASIYKAMEFTDKKSGKTKKPDPQKGKEWITKMGAETFIKRCLAIANKIPSKGLPKKDMPFLPGPDDAKGKVSDVEDALSPGGKMNVDFVQNGKGAPAPAPNTFVGMGDEEAQKYMTGGLKDGDPNDDNIEIQTDNVTAKASECQPTQSNILIPKSVGMAINGVSGGNLGAYLGKIEGSDNAILDGHHRWAATMLNNPTAEIGGFARVDLTKLGTKLSLQHLTAMGNALGNKTKTS